MTTSFKEIVLQNKPLLLPVAHDALTAKLIENAGFSAYQVGGFAVSASKLASPDIGLLTFGETYPAVADIMRASTLPLIIDCDTGGNGPKDVVRMVETYESMGVAGIFFEDQAPPKHCGHMSAANLISRENYVSKLEAALSARKSNDFFIMARTDSFKSEGINGVQERGESYLSAGADALFIDGLQTMEDITAVGEIFKGDEIILATTVLEGGDEVEIKPDDLYNEGFRIVLYPTSILFRMVENIKDTLEKMLDYNLEDAPSLMTMDDFEKEIDIKKWESIEKRYEN
jgi:2-methylisocitrate lyase-like PEP mutase family enzyme